MTSFGDAPQWVKFLVVDEKKRRIHFQRDETLISLDGLAEAEDEGEDALEGAVSLDVLEGVGQIDPQLEEAELRIDAERSLARQKPQDREILAFLQAGHTQAETGEQFGYSQRMIGKKVAALKASLQRFLGN